MISRAIAFESATSDPTSIPSHRSAHSAEVVRRGSTTTSSAPLRIPFSVMEEDRMRLARIRSPQHDEVGVFDLLVRAGSPTCSEHRRQTDDRRSVSGAVAAIDVVAAKDLTHELLRDEVHLVGRLRAAEQADPVAGVPLGRRPQTRRGPVEGLVPGRRARPPFSRTIGSVSRVSPFFIEACSFPSTPNRFYAARRRPNPALRRATTPL